MTSPVAVGVDGCPGGWVAVAWSDTGLWAAHTATLADLEAQLPGAVYGVDIPIGLPVDGVREADLAARRVLGRRASSVFLTPVREAVLATTYTEACDVSRRITGKALSRQSYGLRAKILDADAWIAHTSAAVYEVHPECSFTLLLGHVPRAPKRTWHGQRERLEALHGAGLDLETLDGDCGPAGADDVLDAAVAAWSARRVVEGGARSLPDDPPLDPVTGRPLAIWA